jgi:hypothetical protein
MVRRSVFAVMLLALFSLLTACGPSISSLTIACPANTVKWEADGDSVTLGSSNKKATGLGNVSPTGELAGDANQPAIYWITAASGDDKVSTAVSCPK